MKNPTNTAAETIDQMRDRLFLQRNADRAPLVAAVVKAQVDAIDATLKFGTYDRKAVAAREAEITASQALLDHDHAAITRDRALIDAAMAS